MAEPFHIGIGGPFYRLERAAHIDKLGRLIPLFIAVTWAPLLALALTEELISGRHEPLLRDLSVHARLLVALPLLLAAERVLDHTCGVTIGRAFDEGYIPAAATRGVRALLDRVARWRDSSLPESLMLAVALASGVAALTGLTPPAGTVHGLEESPHGLVHVWYALVSLPLFQFSLWRSLFRWVLWMRVLVELSRAPLRLLPAHADRRGGLAFLKHPTLAYGAVLLLALSSVLCAGWGTQVELYGTSVASFRSLFLSFVLVGVLAAFAPLGLFVPKLLRARLEGERRYGALVSDYAQQFEARWIDRAARPDLLGTSDIQSLADLSTSYRENVERLQLVLFAPADWILLLVAALLPALPLLLTTGPAQDVIKKLLHLAVGLPR
jgi:hypothetical protein